MRKQHTHSSINNPLAQPLWQRLFEQGLLAVMVAVAVLRATITETPHIEPIGQPSPLSNEAVSLLLSSVLLALPVLWLIISVSVGRLRWRRTFFALPAGLFCAAALAGVLFASDKRAALTDLATLASGPAAGLLAVQLFHRREAVRLFLWLLLAVGAAATYACYEKMSESGDALIAEYQRDPTAMLDHFGIEEGSLDHWFYEHRLYARDVSGFLTTSNSTGSFFLLVVFAGIGLCVEAFRARGNEETLVALVCTALATAIPLAGLWMTQSKGANGTFLIFMPVFVVWGVWGRRLWRYRRAIGIFLVVGVVAAVLAMTLYGLRHDRLPGGNSMLVRWHYWAASVDIARENPLLGVGGGNYAAAYLRHKIPAALETINDPHNWVFSLLCRFGIVGLLAMAAAMLRPTERLFQDAAQVAEGQTPEIGKQNWTERFGWITLLVGVTAAMVLVRPIILDVDAAAHAPAERAAAFLLLTIIPAAIIALVFGLLRFACVGDASLHRPNTALIAAIACGLAAVLVHNLVDFALFEPGVWTLFWLLTAAGLSLTSTTAAKPIILSGKKAVAVALSAVLLFAVYVAVFVVPPVRRGLLVHRAVYSSVEHSIGRLDQSAAADPLSPNAAVIAARLLSGRAESMGRFETARQTELLKAAERFAETAVARNPADARPRRLLGELYLAAAERADDASQIRDYREKAKHALRTAVDYFPGSDILHYKLGVLYETMGHRNEAIYHLERAQAIEYAYRKQFALMYPEQDEIISRLGPTVYKDLLGRLERLRDGDID